MKPKRKPTQKPASTTRYPFYDDAELLAIEKQEVHVPPGMALQEIVPNEDYIWEKVEHRLSHQGRKGR